MLIEGQKNIKKNGGFELFKVFQEKLNGKNKESVEEDSYKETSLIHFTT